MIVYYILAAEKCTILNQNIHENSLLTKINIFNILKTNKIQG